MLYLLAGLPLLVGLYLLVLRRKKKVALRYANLALVREAMGAANWRRHIPAALLLTALTVMILSIARPQAVLTLPSQRSTVILAIDSSGSMRAGDVSPDRITGALEAARAFVEEQPHDVRIGVVAFAATALLIQAPTFNREDIQKSIQNFNLQRGTNIGGGILVSLKTLFPDANFDDPDDPRGGRFGRPSATLGQAAPQSKDAQGFTPVPPGSNTTSVIILLSDGQATTGPDPVEAARKAAERGVRVFTVGLGSPDGAITSFGGFSMRVSLDEDTLRRVADMTRGQYFRANTSADLRTIYKSLNTQLILETKQTEITAIFSAAAVVLTILAGMLSMLWFNRVL